MARLAVALSACLAQGLPFAGSAVGNEALVREHQSKARAEAHNRRHASSNPSRAPYRARQNIFVPLVPSANSGNGRAPRTVPRIEADPIPRAARGGKRKMTKKLTSVFERTGRLAAALILGLSLAQWLHSGWLSLRAARDIGARGQRSCSGRQQPVKSARCGP